METTLSSPHADRVRLFGIEIDRITLAEAINRVQAWLREPATSCRFVVTPNLDHIIQLDHNERLRDAYAHASLVIADGWPIVTASHWLGNSLPERVAGSDLVPGLLAACQAERRFTTFLLGAMPGVAEKAAEQIQAKWPNNQVVGVHSPPLGFERDRSECEHIVELIRAHQPDLLVVGLGAPKQELWIHEFRNQLACKVAIAAGATIDFLAGEQTRAPLIWQRLRLEWCHRLLSDPRRLASRYFRDALRFPALCWREYRKR